jgi:hypothetical protein
MIVKSERAELNDIALH